LNNFMKYDFLA